MLKIIMNFAYYAPFGPSCPVNPATAAVIMGNPNVHTNSFQSLAPKLMLRSKYKSINALIATTFTIKF